MILLFILLSFVTLGCKSQSAVGKGASQGQSGTGAGGSNGSKSLPGSSGRTAKPATGSVGSSGNGTTMSDSTVTNPSDDEKFDELLTKCKQDPYKMVSIIEDYRRDNNFNLDDNAKVKLINNVASSLRTDRVKSGDDFIIYCIKNSKLLNLEENNVSKIASNISNIFESLAKLYSSDLQLAQKLYGQCVKKTDYLSLSYIINDHELINKIPKDVLIDLIKNHVKISDDTDNSRKLTTQDLLGLVNKYDPDIIAGLANKVSPSEVNGKPTAYDPLSYQNDIYEKIKNDYSNFMNLSDDAIINLIEKCNHGVKMGFIIGLSKKKGVRDSLLIKLSDKVSPPTYSQFDVLFNRKEGGLPDLIIYFKSDFEHMPEEALLNILKKVKDESVLINADTLTYLNSEDFKKKYSDKVKVIEELFKKVKLKTLGS